MELSDLISVLMAVQFSGASAAVLPRCGAKLLQDYQDNSEAQRDNSVAPCDDFYTHVCGNWDAPYQLRRIGARDTLTAVKARNKQLLMQHFESTSVDSLTKHPDQQDLVQFYHSCVDPTSAVERNTSIEAYVSLLREFGEWPVLSANFTEDTSFALTNLSAQLRRYGASALWRTLIQSNWQASEQLVFYVMPPAFDFLLQRRRERKAESTSNGDDDEVFLYKTYVKYLFLAMGVRVRKAIKFADEVVLFEQELMALTASEENSVVLSEPQTLVQLDSDIPDLQLRKFFEALFQDVQLAEDFAQKLLIVADRKYLRKLSKFLQKTKNETLGKYLLVQFLTHFEVNLHDDMIMLMRQKHCLQQVNTFMPTELSRLFLDLRHEGNGMDFLQQAQRDLGEMFGNLKLHFETMINATNVFDHNTQTRIEGLEKLHAMQLKLPNLTKEYNGQGPQSNVRMSGHYDSNLLNLSKRRVLQELTAISASLALSRPPTSSQSEANNDFTVTNYGPLDVNAYYRLKKNAIEIPVGLLSLPIYDTCLDDAAIYGAIAYIVGHELLHGFDYDGLNYDKSGNIASGWDPKSIIAYGTKASCYLGPRYSDAHTNVNENIADSEGLRLAFGALQKKSTALAPEKQKLFFTSFAQIWCRAPGEYAEHSVHAAHRERVNNVLSNFPEFAEVYHCQAGREMNPAEKCRIW